MSESCCAPQHPQADGTGRPAPQTGRPACPRCGQPGKPVDRQLVKAMLAVSLRRIVSDEYFFCRTETCPVVYFSGDGASSFCEDEVRELVYQKHPHDPDVLICYCFRHKAADLANAPAAEAARILDDIKTGTAAGQCACDIRNPQGSCCLGNASLVARLGRADRPND